MPATFRKIADVAAELQLPQHVLRYWEKRFPQVRPLWKNRRRFYKHEDVTLLRGIQHLLYVEGYAIRGVQRIIKEKGADHVREITQPQAA